MNNRDQHIHQNALQKASNFKKAEGELLHAIEQVNQHKVFRKLGKSSLFRYVMDELGFSEAVTYGFIAVARKSSEVPELGAVIDRQELSVSKAQKIVPVINRDNQKQWIKAARTLSSRKLEKLIAEANPKKAVPEKASYITAERVQLQIGVDEKLMLDLRRIQDFESQRLGRAASLEDILKSMTAFYISKKDPQVKAKRAVVKGSGGAHAQKSAAKVRAVAALKTKNKPATSEEKCRSASIPDKQYQQKLLPGGVLGCNRSSEADTAGGTANFHHHPQKPRLRTPIPAYILHRVRLRDNGQCTYHDKNGKRCSQKRWLHNHHDLPVSHGGDHSVENIRLLCQEHHKQIHAEEESKV